MIVRMLRSVSYRAWSIAVLIVLWLGNGALWWASIAEWGGFTSNKHGDPPAGGAVGIIWSVLLSLLLVGGTIAFIVDEL